MKLFHVSILTLLCVLSPFEAITSPDIGELPNENQIPRLVTMNFYHDAKSEMAFRWNTTYKTDSDLEMVLANDGDFEGEHVLSFQGTCEKSPVIHDGFIHSVVATNLKANATYLYRVGDKELNAWSRIGLCQTETDDMVTNFIHISDPQAYEEVDAKGYQETLQMIDRQRPHFICLTGDIVNNSWEGYTPILEQWEWTITDQEVVGNYPIMPVAGNHDAASYDFTSRYHLPYADGQDLSKGGYYSFDYHNIHFIALNTNDSSSDPQNLKGLSTNQIEWLKNDLKAAKNAKWKVVMMHKGIFDAGGHCSNVEGTDGDIAYIREQVSPIFSDYQVDLVLQGHDHLYSRSYPIQGREKNGAFYPFTQNETKVEIEKDGVHYSVYQDPSGPIYVNTGSASGSKYYGVVNYDKEMIPLEIAYSATAKMFTSYHIDQDGLYANVYEIINGEAILHDTFGIQKTAGNSNKDFPPNLFITIGIVMGALLGIGLITLLFLLYRKKKGAIHHG